MSTKKVVGVVGRWQPRRSQYASSRDGHPRRGGDRRSLRRINPPAPPPFASIWVATSVSCGAFPVGTKSPDRTPGDIFRAIPALPSFAPSLRDEPALGRPMPGKTRWRSYLLSVLFDEVSALDLLSFFPESLLESALPSEDSPLGAEPPAGFLA